MTLSLIRSLLFLALVVLPCAARAQDQTPESSATAAATLLKPEEIDALVAPIALYPDTLLSQVLMASTYPLDVVSAERWLKANKNLTGDALKDAVSKQSWDDSVKSLVATPSVLETMNANLDWTQKLGNAVISQQADVMDAIQRLRAKAQAYGKLKSTEQQTVTVRQEQDRQIIAIAPTDPNTIYVPYYDPEVVYGAWSDPAYPPYYWEAPGYIATGLLASGLVFGTGYLLGRWATGGYWGGNVNWNRNNITINRAGAAANWNRGARVEQRLGNRGGREHGLNFRGSGGRQVLNPGGGGGLGGGRANLGGGRPGQQPGLGNRGGGHRAQTRPSHGRQAARTRPSHGGGRAHAATRNRGGGHAGRGGFHGGGGFHHRGGGGMRAHGGGGFRGGRGGGGRGGGRRSDIRLKHDIVYLGRLDDGLGFYRFIYDGGHEVYVGVMAQDVKQVMPQAVSTGRDGYFRVNYQELGLTFETYDAWVRAGARIPSIHRVGR